MHGVDGKRGWLVRRHSHKRTSPKKEKPHIGTRDIQGDTEITIRGDTASPFGTLFG